MITVAVGANSDITTKKTYVYKINFQCLADTIEEADECFLQETRLHYHSKKDMPGYLCPLVTVEVTAAPKNGYGKLTEERTPTP